MTECKKKKGLNHTFTKKAILFLMVLSLMVGFCSLYASAGVIYLDDDDVVVYSDVKFKEIASGGSHTLGVGMDGLLYAWGSNDSGQLGNGTTTAANTPQHIIVGTNVAKIACGAAHSVAMSPNGKLCAWGDNDYGQLGNGTTDDSDRAKPVTVANVVFADIACGDNFTVALTNDGKIYAWGDNTFGQLGNGTNTASSTPQLIDVPGVTFTKIACGSGHVMALSSDGQLYAWGLNDYGQLGNGTTENAKTPQPITVSGVAFADISCGARTGGALSSNGDLYFWGTNGNSQFGDGTFSLTGVTPAIFNQSHISVSKVINGRYRTYLLTDDGLLYGAGTEAYNCLGAGGGDYSRFNLAANQMIYANVTYDFKTNGGTQGSTTSQVLSERYVNLNVTDGSNKFIGWNIDPDATTKLNSIQVINFANVLNLYALYADCTITFPEIDHVTFAPVAGSTTVEYGSDFSFTATFDPGYEGTISYGDGTVLTPVDGVYTIEGVRDDITVSCELSTIEYTITYVLNGGTNNPFNPSKYTVEDKEITLLDPTRTHYTFAGWLEGEIIDTSGAVNVTRTATWTINRHTVDFVTDGGSAINPITLDYGSTIGTAPMTIKDGFTFDGWFTDSSLTTPASFLYTITGDATLYAKWTVAPVRYTVTYNANGATGGTAPTDANEYLSGAEATVLDNTGTLVKIGYRFVGWNTEPDGSGTTYAPGDLLNIGDGNITLFAMWEQEDNGNGGGNGGGNNKSCWQRFLDCLYRIRDFFLELVDAHYSFIDKIF